MPALRTPRTCQHFCVHKGLPVFARRRGRVTIGPASGAHPTGPIGRHRIACPSEPPTQAALMHSTPTTVHDKATAPRHSFAIKLGEARRASTPPTRLLHPTWSTCPPPQLHPTDWESGQPSWGRGQLSLPTAAYAQTEPPARTATLALMLSASLLRGRAAYPAGKAHVTTTSRRNRLQRP
jgi:hypothetical protein